MAVGKLTLEISIPHAQSLKDRRQVVRSLKEKLRHSFNVSIAEMDEAVVWNRATLGIVCISSSAAYVEGQMRVIEAAAQRLVAGTGGEIADAYAELLESAPSD